MGKSQETWSKKEREKKKLKQRQEKAEKKQERKESGGSGKSLEDMMAYIDEFGNISSTPPDPSRRVEVKLEDVVIGVPKHVPGADVSPIRSGVVTFFNETKGFGFIKDSQTQESIFVHINACNDRIQENSKVTFEVERGPRGLQASGVSLAPK